MSTEQSLASSNHSDSSEVTGSRKGGKPRDFVWNYYEEISAASKTTNRCDVLQSTKSEAGDVYILFKSGEYIRKPVTYPPTYIERSAFNYGVRTGLTSRRRLRPQAPVNRARFSRRIDFTEAPNLQLHGSPRMKSPSWDSNLGALKPIVTVHQKWSRRCVHTLQVRRIYTQACNTMPSVVCVDRRLLRLVQIKCASICSLLAKRSPLRWKQK